MSSSFRSRDHYTRAQVPAIAAAIRAEIPFAARHVCDDASGPVAYIHDVEISASGTFVRIYDKDGFCVGLAQDYLNVRTGRWLVEVQS